MNISLLNLKELIKSYTVAASVANSTGRADDLARAQALLNQINNLRTELIINAEMREIFYLQKDIPAAANANTTQNVYVSKNDIDYTFRRGIAVLNDGVTIAMFNQGAHVIAITRNETPWQHLFSNIQQAAPVGQQTLFDLPQTLIFTENQSLGLGIKGQDQAAGFIFLHGATLKDDLAESSIAEVTREFLSANGKTSYIPETQLVPLEFKFPSATAGTLATDANGDTNIFSLKNARSVLLTHVSSNVMDCLVTLNDEGKNLNICESLEMRGLAADQSNQFTSWYELPEPHLLRKGDRLKARLVNGSNITDDTVDAPTTLQYLTFKGQTV